MTILLIAVAMLFCQNGNAQERDRDWSIIPRVGLNFSNLGDMTVWYGDDMNNMDNKISPNVLTDYTLGADFEYFFHPALSVSLGAHYSRQGCHYRSYSTKYTTDKPNEYRCEGVDNNNIRLQYINVPVSAALHVTDYLAIKAGIQCGFNISGNWTSDVTTWTQKLNETEDFSTISTNEDIKWMCAKTVWAIPVGIELEYENVIINAGYSIPLSGFCKEVPIPGGASPERMSNGRNKVWTISVGYRL